MGPQIIIFMPGLEFTEREGMGVVSIATMCSTFTSPSPGVIVLVLVLVLVSVHNPFG